MRRLIAPAAALMLGGCGGAPEPIPGTTARMDYLDSTPYAAPWPGEHLRGPDGRIDTRRLPASGGVDFVRDVRRIIGRDASGFGTTSAVFFAMTGAMDPGALPGLHRTAERGAPAFLIDVEPSSPERGRRIPVHVGYEADGGPFGAAHLVSLLPLQGVPLRPDTLYAAGLTRDLEDAAGEPLGASQTLRALVEGADPAGLSAEATAAFEAAVAALPDAGVDPERLAALTVFRTRDPTAVLLRAAEALRPAAPEPDGPLELVETHPDFCVFRTTITMPVFQAGEPPFETDGGEWRLGEDGLPIQQGEETARLFVTLPRTPPPQGGFPAVLFVRTGGGGDRPLIDRGIRGEPGGEPLEPGTGPARELARVGFAGVMVDGPHGGPRNVTGGDEQFLIFNVQNPVAMRDNVRQSALELALMSARLEDLTITSSCAGASESVRLDPGRLALMGHSMGATIAPLALAAAPELSALILSGAGGSWIHNIVEKQSPLVVRPLAEIILDYDEIERTLSAGDPALSLLQWAGEDADPPVYARALERDPRHVLMLQGVVDTYILPPIANATSLSFGLDLAGEPEEDSLEPLLPLVGRGRRPLPAQGNLQDGTITGVVVQHRQGPVEDGHEVVFQTEPPKAQYRRFLESWAAGAPPVVPTVDAP